MCAGEIVPLVEFGLQASEREVFEAQLYFDAGDMDKAKAMAYKAMLSAAQALVKTEFHDISDDPEQHRHRVQGALSTKRSASTTSSRARSSPTTSSRPTKSSGNGGRPEQARDRVQEAQLFIEAAYKVL